MVRGLTIDASVFVSALSPSEVRGEESFRFVERLADVPCLLILPTLVRPEVAGAIGRLTGNTDTAREAAEMAFLACPTVYVELDQRLAQDAADLAAEHGLRGADAVYAATARRFDAILVTLDGEQRTRLPPDIPVLWPREVELG